jgi:hypothetical protein
MQKTAWRLTTPCLRHSRTTDIEKALDTVKTVCYLRDMTYTEYFTAAKAQGASDKVASQYAKEMSLQWKRKGG